VDLEVSSSETPAAAVPALSVVGRHRYAAFLSYSHAADGKLATAMQSALHQLARRSTTKPPTTSSAACSSQAAWLSRRCMRSGV
jgi:hypothetical protein